MASGDTLLVFTPLHNEPPASDYATLDVRNEHPVLDFDAANEESAVFSGVLPRHYSGGGITVYLHVAFSSATSGNSVWQVAFERIGIEHQDMDADSFAAAKQIDISAGAPSGQILTGSVAYGHGADMDGLLAGEGFRLKVTRNADDGDDDAAGDAELRFVELKET
jgi:hypothetical protein